MTTEVVVLFQGRSGREPNRLGLDFQDGEEEPKRGWFWELGFLGPARESDKGRRVDFSGRRGTREEVMIGFYSFRPASGTKDPGNERLGGFIGVEIRVESGDRVAARTRSRVNGAVWFERGRMGTSQTMVELG